MGVIIGITLLACIFIYAMVMRIREDAERSRNEDINEGTELLRQRLSAAGHTNINITVEEV